MILGPRLLIADEPTTALDVTVEAQILQLMRTLSAGGTGILLISHDLGVIAQMCDHVYVMYAGRMVESADVTELFDRPLHPYTRGLLNSVRSLRGGGDALDACEEMRRQAADVPEMSLDESNEEIRVARREREAGKTATP